jgi:subtilisin family serine protease
VIRRVFFATATLTSSLALSMPAMPVHAAVFEAPEMIAHAVVAPTSPQTSGPSVLAAPYNAVPWGLDRIDQRSNTLDNSYSFSGNGAGVKVYVVDSGVNATHVEFGASSRVVNGWSYRADVSASNTSVAELNDAYYVNSNVSYHNARVNGFISACTSKPQTQQYDPATFDDKVNAAGADTTDRGKVDNDGHGTHVAGTIGGEVTGAAKGVTIVPVRVLDSCGSGTTNMVRNGLRWILNDHLQGEKAVVNMSIGFDASATPIDLEITKLLGEGVVVVAAAGNDASSACNSTPAGTIGTISVGAIDRTSKEAYYSNFGECVDIFAPGSEVLSSWPKNGVINDTTYYLETGTSMAAPHVAGVAALLLVGRTVTASTPSEIWALLKTSSTCDVVTYYDTTRAANLQTPNRLLNTGIAPGMPCKPMSATATAVGRSLTVSWAEPVSPNGAAITGYSATLVPGGAACNVDAVTFTCTISNLVSNTLYTASVVAINSVGASTPITASATTPEALPGPLVEISAVAKNKALSLSWVPPVIDGPGITYVATAQPGGASCSTASTSCVIAGLKNGVSYSISVAASNTSGAVSVAVLKARPGFTVKTTLVKKQSRTTLSKIVVAASKGKKTWSESGLCSIVSGKLVAPSKKTTCKVTLKVAKSGSYPAMSTTVSVAVK